MARLLLLAFVVLVAAHSAAAAGGAPLARCAVSQLRVSVETQGVSTATWIGVTLRNRGRACTLAGSVSFSIRQAGRRAAVSGNPLSVPVRGALAHRRTRLAKAAWNNWCRSRAGFRLVVRYEGVTVRKRFARLPVCIDRRRPSQLVPID